MAIHFSHFLSQGQVPLLIADYGYGAVGGIIALESIGVPVPGETTLIAAALVAGTTHALDIWLVITAAAGGAIVGDNIGYCIGRWLGSWLLVRYGHYVRITEQRIKLGEYLFLRHGGKVVFFGRFVALFRALAAFLAGANRMPWSHFLFFNAAGGIVWAMNYGLGAYYLGEAATHLAEPAAIAIGVVALILIGIFVIFIHRHEAELKARAEQAFPGPIRIRHGQVLR
jgi:membrane protein DedA with SNARE-associated domain